MKADQLMNQINMIEQNEKKSFRDYLEALIPCYTEGNEIKNKQREKTS